MDLVINVSLAFIEGFGIILSPCILPVLPIIFATSLVGGKYKPYGIMLGFLVAFCAFTLFARAVVLSAGVNLDYIRFGSFIVLLLLACIMMSNVLSDQFAKLTQGIAHYGTALIKPGKQEGGFLNGLLIGLPIGLIWTPCAGPIIAAVIVQTIRTTTTSETFLTLFAFSLGVAIPILLIILCSKQLLNRQRILTTHAQSIRKILGAALFFGVVLTMQGSVYLAASDSGASKQQLQSNDLIDPLAKPYAAPEIQGISDWINTSPISLSQLKGKVVLIDFWTYSCINCLRTMPYLKAWYAKYHSMGLEIIGIHSPEFAFEQRLDNVQQAVKQLGILYPVALDNLFKTWDNYRNQYWPAHYLINKQGQVVYTHFGEGHYAVTEHNIQVLLGQKTGVATQQMQPNEMISFGALTPETYLGSDRASGFAGLQVAVNTYKYPKVLKQDSWALQGKWQITPQKIISGEKGSAITVHFQAQKVFVVLGTQDKQIKTATVLLNGKPVGNLGGKAVKNSQLLIKADTLYELINLPQKTNGMIEIIFDQPGVEAYALTFG